MDVSNINFLAVVAAGLSAWILGSLWYSKALFGKAWMEAVGLTEEQIASGGVAKTISLTFIFGLIMAFNLAMFFYGSPEAAEAITAGSGAFYGFLTGFGWIFFVIATNALYEQKSWGYIFINGGFWTVAFTIMGLILGAWK
ncbi:MAG: DUF1761 domain-containing protein [Balneolaceae bacterium]|nr:DUF1761 domain-containing protein [Balneolaceae bacterium]